MQLHRELCLQRCCITASLPMALQVMQKVFALLLVEFRKLGATIVFASFSRIIIDPGKSDLSAAKAYCDSVLKTLQTRDLFEWIEIEPFQFWHSLLFMDQYNYGGIQARSEDRSTEEYSHAGTESVYNDSQVDIVSSWTIAENLTKATQVMRRNLLKLVCVREFTREAEFQNLHASLTLPNVICRDLDLCRDRALIAQEWRCAVPQCGQPYDREVVENALLQIICQRERLYHLQDLVCLKCNQIKAAHLAEHCPCAGSFVCKEDSSEFRSKMQTFQNVTVDQKFQRLQESSCCTSYECCPNNKHFIHSIFLL